MGSDDGGVDKDFFEVGVGGQRGEKAFPEARICPVGKVFVSGMPMAELAWQIARGHAGAGDVEHRFDEPVSLLVNAYLQKERGRFASTDRCATSVGS